LPVGTGGANATRNGEPSAWPKPGWRWKKWRGSNVKRPTRKKLASQAGRMLERLKAHKYLTCRVNPPGLLEWEAKQATIRK
jgi:hypothetical protein